jgi:hypothetical protein
MGGGTLFEALQSIPDHRTKKGTRFPLAAILAIAIAAMLSGANDLMAIFRWGRRLSPKALQALGVDKKRKRAHAMQPITMFSNRFQLPSLQRPWAVSFRARAGLAMSPSTASACAAASAKQARACTCCKPFRPSSGPL